MAGPASRLKEAGVVLFCIGVEPDSLTPDEIETMKDEMRLIASEPTKHHLFISDGYHELERKVEGISRAACVGLFLFVRSDDTFFSCLPMFAKPVILFFP